MSDYYVNSDHILVGPNVLYKPIPEALTQPKILPWNVILHSNAAPHLTRWESMWAYVNRLDVTGEPHFQVDMDGHVLQYLPLNVRADCNAKANSWKVDIDGAPTLVGAISFETQDNGSATLAKTPWAIPQLDAITGAIAAIGHKYGVPYTNPVSWDDRGVGHHCEYKEWSIYVGKTCPGAARIRQMDYVRNAAAGLCACNPYG
jgi:N-acetylmuramoyl-L-alanine amidase